MPQLTPARNNRPDCDSDIISQQPHRRSRCYFWRLLECSPLHVESIRKPIQIWKNVNFVRRIVHHQTDNLLTRHLMGLWDCGAGAIQLGLHDKRAELIR